ncbi:type II toxin-antitoxin system VapC family toxin [Aliiroseovarius sp. 2305UL8-7]|uniref:type II toxin-antitoxin system VapC family toxin n=1 Tax=Aliiroseovarius conchicola TaxID=3121637 RepID=UPI003526D186
MIAVDTSALMAILLDEREAAACTEALTSNERLLISAATLAEAQIVADRRGIGDEMRDLVTGLGFEVVSLSAAAAQRVATAYQTWGKGIHPAGLNFGDCFAYALAQEYDCPLLFIGNDFTKTDLVGVL